MAATEQDNSLPLSKEETRRMKGRAPSGKPTAELAGLEDKAPPEKVIRLLDRAAMRAADAPAALEARVPKWVGTSFAAASPTAPPPPVVTRHGDKLDPLVIVPPRDDRQPYSATTYPWICVCRITRPDGAQGSGVLIGPRHVLTASHVVQWNTTAAEKIEVNFAGSNALATAFTQTAYAYTKITGGVSYSTVDEDYACITLNQRLGDRFGWLGTKEYDSGWDGDNVWTTFGYPGGVARPNFPHVQSAFSLDEDAWDYGSGRAMTTTADASKGQSGSPIFAWWPDNGVYAVAVMSAVGGGENWCSGGSDLNRIVKHARTVDP
ncbi:MAG: serine protease [Parvibaculaceae bacterium]